MSLQLRAVTRDNFDEVVDLNPLDGEMVAELLVRRA